MNIQIFLHDKLFAFLKKNRIYKHPEVQGHWDLSLSPYISNVLDFFNVFQHHKKF